MRTSTRIGIIGSTFAVAGGAAFGALAPNAAASGGYNSKASAESGAVNVGGTPAAPVSVSATPSSGPQAASVPSSSLTDQLKQGLAGFPIPITNISAGPDLVAVEADASSNGHSNGCAIVLGSNCDGGGAPLTFTLALSQAGGGLAGIGGGAPLPDVTVTVNGPKASCGAGHDGHGLHASDDQGTVTASISGGSPVTIGPGDNLLGALGPIVADLAKQVSITPVVGQGSTSRNGGSATATAGDIGLSSGGTTLFDVKGATATCGPNNAAGGSGGSGGSGGGTGGSGGSGGSGGTGGAGTTGATGPAGTTIPTIPTSTSTSGENPLGGGIQTDEGRSSSSAPAWLALTGTP